MTTTMIQWTVKFCIDRVLISIHPSSLCDTNNDHRTFIGVLLCQICFTFSAVGVRQCWPSCSSNCALHATYKNPRAYGATGDFLSTAATVAAGNRDTSYELRTRRVRGSLGPQVQYTARRCTWSFFLSPRFFAPVALTSVVGGAVAIIDVVVGVYFCCVKRPVAVMCAPLTRFSVFFGSLTLIRVVLAVIYVEEATSGCHNCMQQEQKKRKSPSKKQYHDDGTSTSLCLAPDCTAWTAHIYAMRVQCSVYRLRRARSKSLTSCLPNSCHSSSSSS